MENTHHGKLLAIRSPDTFIISMEVKLFSTFLLLHLEVKLKIIISSLLNLFGTGMLKTERSVGIQVA